LEEKNLITYHSNRIEFVMKDLDGNVVWIQERYLQPINLNGKQLKSKTKTGTHAGYFFHTDIDFSKPIIITEWEIDTYSLELPNIIWLQGISGLKALVEQLQEKKVQDIYILTDNDEPSNKAIGSLLNFDKVFLSWIYDSRSVLGDLKDVNEYIVANGDITLEKIQEHGKWLHTYLDLIDDLIIYGERWWVSINHNNFSQYFIKKYNISTVGGNIFQYQNWIWKLLDSHFVKKSIIDEIEILIATMIKKITISDTNNIYEFMLANGYDVWLEQNLFIQDNTDINLQDWIYSPADKTLTPYKREHYKIQKFNYPYNIFSSYEVPSKWLYFLNEILDGYQDKDSIIWFLQEFLGYCLTESTKFEKALLVYGGWCNGKGVLFSVVRHILGEENCSSIPLHTINNPQNLYTLFGKLINIEGDMSHGVQLDDAIIKKLVSWERIMIKPMYKQPIEFWPKVKLLIATNTLPFLKSIDNSVRRRFAFLELKQSFYGKEDITLVDKLITEKESIFVWAIQWLGKLLARWNFEIPTELVNLLEVFIKDNDPVASFIEDMNIVQSDTNKVSNADIYKSFSIYCKQNWLQIPRSRIFNQSLVNKWFKKFKDSNRRWFMLSIWAHCHIEMPD
jgi:putative DNA primase/helicase